MKKELMIALTAFASFFSTKQGLAASSPQRVSNDPLKADLTDSLIKTGALKINSKTLSVQIDENQLLQALRSELSQKIAALDSSEQDKYLYQELLLRLQPGSFNKENTVLMRSMSFAK